MKEETKKKLIKNGFAIVFFGIIIGMVFLLFYADHIIPDIEPPQNHNGSWHPEPSYYFPVMLSIIMTAIMMIVLIFGEDVHTKYNWALIFILVVGTGWIYGYVQHIIDPDTWYYFPIMFSIGLIWFLTLLKIVDNYHGG